MLKRPRVTESDEETQTYDVRSVAPACLSHRQFTSIGHSLRAKQIGSVPRGEPGTTARHSTMGPGRSTRRKRDLDERGAVRADVSSPLVLRRAWETAER
jgi:hypothetical protein